MARTSPEAVVGILTGGAATAAAAPGPAPARCGSAQPQQLPLCPGSGGGTSSAGFASKKPDGCSENPA